MQNAITKILHLMNNTMRFWRLVFLFLMTVFLHFFCSILWRTCIVLFEKLYHLCKCYYSAINVIQLRNCKISFSVDKIEEYSFKSRVCRDIFPLSYPEIPKFFKRIYILGYWKCHFAAHTPQLGKGRVLALDFFIFYPIRTITLLFYFLFETLVIIRLATLWVWRTRVLPADKNVRANQSRCPGFFTLQFLLRWMAES